MTQAGIIVRNHTEERENNVKQFYGMSQKGDLKEAVSRFQNPQFLMLMRSEERRVGTECM